MNQNGSADDLLAEQVAKLHTRVDGHDEELANLNGRIRTIASGQARRVSRLGDIFLAAVAFLLVMLVVTASLYSYLIRNPWPFSVRVPPPHSTQLPQEVPKR